MLKSGKELKVFSVKADELKKLQKKQKRYGGLYSVLIDKKMNSHDGVIDILVRAEDASKINTIIVKDLSRIGRNYIEVGNFIDEIIPLYKLRFISINDKIDSYLNPESMNTLEIPFKNLMNENYAKDTSNKIRSTHVVRKQKGDFIGVVAPFGYKKKS